VNEETTIALWHVSCNVSGFGRNDCRGVSDKLVVTNQEGHKNIVHSWRSQLDWDVTIHAGVFAAVYTVRGLGFDLGRRTPRISVTVLAQAILYVVLVTGGRCYNGMWPSKYLLHAQFSGLGGRHKSNDS
jgi:hypothetical protein